MAHESIHRGGLRGQWGGIYDSPMERLGVRILEKNASKQCNPSKPSANINSIAYTMK